MKTRSDVAPELAIVMPAYNEAACIEKVARAWLKVADDHFGLLFIVNDGSRDQTGEVLNQLARKSSSLRVVHQENAGHGSAVRTGYEQALKTGAHYVFQTDSDDQLTPEDFEKLWDARQESPFILGYRIIRRDPLIRIIISRLNAALLLVFFGVEIRDANVPFRLMESNFLSNLLKMIPRHVFAPNIYLSVLAAKSRATLLEIPVEHQERKTGVVMLNRSLLNVCKRCLNELNEFRKNSPRWKKQLAGLPYPPVRDSKKATA